MKFISVLLLIIVLNLHKLCSQSVIISEFLASNVRDFPEMQDFDDYTDWIEIHNPSFQPFTFYENFITDDLGDPFKWKVPNGIVIESEGYLIIWADDYNEIPDQIVSGVLVTRVLTALVIQNMLHQQMFLRVKVIIFTEARRFILYTLEVVRTT